MKKIISFIIAATLILTPTTTVFAKHDSRGHHGHNQKTEEQYIGKYGTQIQDEDGQVIWQCSSKEQKRENHNSHMKEWKQTFKIEGSPVIKYGRYKLPLAPVIIGMGATVSFDKTTSVLTVSKNAITIIIDFTQQTVTVNGVADANSGIFTASNCKKMKVLIGYIAKTLGIKTSCGDDDVIVTVPGLDNPTNVTVTPVGGTVVTNTLNSTTLNLTAVANIVAGQATGGRAELYVGSKLVAVDSMIAATDTTVTFTTSDGTPINSELQAAVPAGGVVTVKLYNTANQSVTSTVANPTLNVDYAAPAFTSVATAVYSVSGSAITINITGGSAVGDRVDVTKISLIDSTLGSIYQLTATPVTGSTGVVSSANSILVNLGIADKLALTGFGTSTMFLNIAPGSLLSDAAGNTSPASPAVTTIPVIIIS